MQSRRDQVQAHLFVVGRLTSGILGAEPDVPETPLARTTRGLFIGTILALLGIAAFAVFGLLFPGGSQAWRTSRSLLIVKESGARYVYLGGVLHPVLNSASAVLLLGGTQTAGVAAKDLDGVPRGTPVGIPGAPDDLPAATKLGGTRSWQVCAGVGGNDTPTTSVLVARRGTPQVLPQSRGVLVGVRGDANYLLWYGKRYRLPNDHATLGALGYADAPARRVDSAFLNAVPPGPDLVAPRVDDRGHPGPRIGGQPAKVGQLFTLHGSGQHYVLTSGGLRPVTRTEYVLLMARPETAKLAYGGSAPAALPLDGADLAAHADAGRYDDGLPPVPPAATPPGATDAVCLYLQPGRDTPRYGVFLTDAGRLGAHPVVVPEGVAPSCAPAARVAVGDQGGAVVHVLPTAGAAPNSREYLVTPGGVKYPMTPGGAQALGYSTVAATRVPHTVLDALPTGPLLDPALVQAGGSAGVSGCS
ncbi:MAG TPA: type VII secretion protein EccB [Actinocatenispora sp.]